MGKRHSVQNRRLNLPLPICFSRIDKVRLSTTCQAGIRSDFKIRHDAIINIPSLNTFNVVAIE